MTQSMTAYGRAENSDGQNSISCEIRSVNHRYLEKNLAYESTFLWMAFHI